MSRDNKKSDVIMNEDITAKELRCTSDSGENYGIIPTAQALALADEADRIGIFKRKAERSVR